MRVYIEVYGCWLNRGEAEAIATLLVRRGCEITEDAGEADALVLVTCAVRGDTENRMLRRVATLSLTRAPGRSKAESGA